MEAATGRERWRYGGPLRISYAPLKTPIHWRPNPRRSHECERGTQECLRYGASSSALVGRRSMSTPLKTPVQMTEKNWLAGESALPHENVNPCSPMWGRRFRLPNGRLHHFGGASRRVGTCRLGKECSS